MRSLSRTLAVRFSLTVFVALLLIALWAYLGAQRILRDQLDRGLHAAALLEADVLASGYELPRHHGAPDLETFVATINRFVVVRSGDGALLATNTPAGVSLPADARALARALRGEVVWTSETWDGRPVRSVYLPVPRGTDSGSVVQVTASLAPLHRANWEILFLLLGTVILGTIATAMGAAWLAQSSVRPVLEITEQARAVRPGSVNQRITVHGDVEEFQGLVTVLNDLLARLERVLASQRRMVADAGHDLRTPLTAMQGEIEVALRGTRSPEEYRSVLASVLEEVERLTSISDSLALLARIDSGTLIPDPSPTDLGCLLAAAVHRAQSHGGGRRFHFHAPASPLVAEVDERLLTIVIDQILDNCLRHTPSHSETTVTAEAVGDRVALVCVEDDGPGVPPHQLPRLLERFYRDDSARSRTAGAGLGLSVAAAIVAAHDGVIRAEKGRRGGLRIAIELPRTRKAAPSASI